MVDPATFPWMKDFGKKPGVAVPSQQVEEVKKEETPPLETKPAVPKKRFIIRKISKPSEPVSEAMSTPSGLTPEQPAVVSVNQVSEENKRSTIPQEAYSVPNEAVRRESRLIIENLEEEFTCQTCGERFKNWMLYIDVPCPDLCLSCHKCLYNNKMCRKCGRKLTQKEVEMVKIYYQTFQSEAWSPDQFLRANES